MQVARRRLAQRVRRVMVLMVLMVRALTSALAWQRVRATSRRRREPSPSWHGAWMPS